MGNVEVKDGDIDNDQLWINTGEDAAESDRFPSVDQVIALLNRQGIEITREQAEAVTFFLGQQANIIVSQFLRRCK